LGELPQPGEERTESVDRAILRTENLKKYFPSKRSFFGQDVRWLKAVDGIDLELKEGDILGIVGESGSGKTTLAKLIQGIYRPTEGAVYFKDINIHDLPSRQMRGLWREIQYVYQNPGVSFDPWWKVERSLEEPLKIHKAVSKGEIKKRVGEIVACVGLEQDHIYRYPHEFSGGQQRRLALARALVLRPSLIVLDEPTSGLDVSIQATILKLLRKLRNEFGLTYIFISHDLEVVRMMSNKIAVMYLGAVVESGPTESILLKPKHHYTQLLLAAVPRIRPLGEETDVFIQGEIPDRGDVPSGCRFWPRCPSASEICSKESPAIKILEDGRKISCHEF